jgi:hypothetical protein
MSFTAAHQSTIARRACQACQERKARFQFCGKVRADRDHVLCFEWYRSERERGGARRLAEVPAVRFLQTAGGFRGRPLTDRRNFAPKTECWSTWFARRPRRACRSFSYIPAHMNVVRSPHTINERWRRPLTRSLRVRLRRVLRSAPALASTE